MRNRTSIGAIAALVLLAAGPARAGSRGPDAAGYTASDAVAYSFVNVAAAGGATVLAGSDDAVAALTLPFAFRFYNEERTIACVSANGALYFVATAASCTNVNDFANVDLSLGSANDWPALFPFWSDLTFQAPGAGGVVYQTVGAPGARRFVVQWNNAFPQGSTNPVTFEIVLAEGSNTILFQYKTVALGAGNASNSGRQATVGIRNAGGASRNEQIEWSYDAPVLHDGMAVLFSNDTTPPVTTASVSGPAGANGWYRGPAQIALSATDPDSAVAATMYAVDGGSLQAYTTPFAVSGDGAHVIVYFSRDPANNVETAHQLRLAIDASAPTITASASPTALWPPNGATTAVVVAGTMTDALSGAAAGAASYEVTDSYGQVQPTGPIAIAPNGSFSVTVPLVAARNGTDKSDRTYTITVRAADQAGNRGTATVIVIVPHDQRQ